MHLSGQTFGEGQPRSIVAVPIMMGGKVIGMLSAQSYEPNIYTEDEQQILSTLANQAAVAIQNGRLCSPRPAAWPKNSNSALLNALPNWQREQRNTETLLRILTEASSTLDLDRALNRTLALLNDAIGAEQGSILMVNPEDNTIHYRAGYGYLTPVMTERHAARPRSRSAKAWRLGDQEPRAVRIDDVRKDKRWVKVPAQFSEPPQRHRCTADGGRGCDRRHHGLPSPGRLLHARST